MQLQKVISGGQTGVDRAALDAALAATVDVGGWCPKGRRAEDGTIPQRYPLVETPSRKYAQRTAWNVRDSDGTLLITDGSLMGGTALTKKEADRRGKPLLHVQTPPTESISRIQRWGAGNDVRVLNVAGPRASEVSGIYEAARALIEELLATVQAK